MRWRFQVLILSAITLTVSGSVSVAASTQSDPVSVHVQPKPSIAGSVHISFHPTDRLPPGGYYYAVMVLKPYKGYTQHEPPPCATSSDMEKTDYGYPHPSHPVRLALTPAKSLARHWCRGGVYSGGIYSVPYPPPCNNTYPCRSEPHKEPSPCFEISHPAAEHAASSRSQSSTATPTRCLRPSPRAPASSPTFRSRSSDRTNSQVTAESRPTRFAHPPGALSNAPSPALRAGGRRPDPTQTPTSTETPSDALPDHCPRRSALATTQGYTRPLCGCGGIGRRAAFRSPCP